MDQLAFKYACWATKKSTGYDMSATGTAAFYAKQRPALRLLVSVVFGRKINLEIARGL
jgi:hypothetical protein